MKPDFKEAAIKHAKLIYPSGNSTRHIVAAADFQIGAEHGYSLAMEQHRDLIERAFVAGRSQTTWEQFKKDNGL